MTKGTLETWRQRLIPLALAVPLGGCIHPKLPDQQPAQRITAPSLDALMPPASWKGLAGRTIVLDPGHGGPDTGCVGPFGHTEKAINLEVALDLAGLLRQAGARVEMTRTTDTAVDPEDPARELPARSALANRLGADLFLSLHHNATLNETTTSHSGTEVFYKMDGGMASREAGESINRWLARGLALPSDALIPGNYAVLRDCQVPAVLGEADYLTHPRTEERLSTPEGIHQEAEAYFLGIRDYFAPGIPVVTDLSVSMSDPLRPRLSARIMAHGAPLDLLGVEVLVDGRPTGADEADVDGDRATWQGAEALAPGHHELSITASNTAGRTSVARTVPVSIDPEFAPYSEASSLAAEMRDPEHFSGGRWTRSLIVVDPEGGDDPVGRVNWKVARLVAADLQHEGQRALLTRPIDDDPTALSRIRMANAEGAAVVLRIGHRAGDGARSHAEHYPKSERGKALGAALSASLARALGTADDGAVMNSGYVLTQLTATAVAIYPEGIERLQGPDADERCVQEAAAIARVFQAP